MEPEKLISLLNAYETDVRFPDTSGVEHFDMLLSRTEIERHKQQLTPEQMDRLAAADEQLAHQVDSFYQSIACVADMAEWRAAVTPAATHWWWYLDVLAHARPSLEALLRRQPAAP
jgi:hypothetical protein